MGGNIVILAGGASSRMKRSVSRSFIDPSLVEDMTTKPKGMIRVGKCKRPFLDYLLYTIENSGYDHVVIVVGEHGDSIRDHYDNKGGAGQFPLLKIEYVVQKVPSGCAKPLGTADALLQAMCAKSSWRGQQVAVCNSDDLYSRKAFRLLLEDVHDNAMIDYDRSCLHYDDERIAQWAVTVKNHEGFLEEIIEKPTLDQIRRMADAQGRIGVSMNIWRFSYDDILPYLETVPLHPVRQEKELNTAIRKMIAEHPHSVYAIPLSGDIVDLTSQPDIPLVQEFIRKKFPHL